MYVYLFALHVRGRRSVYICIYIYLYIHVCVCTISRYGLCICSSFLLVGLLSNPDYMFWRLSISTPSQSFTYLLVTALWTFETRAPHQDWWNFGVLWVVVWTVCVHVNIYIFIYTYIGYTSTHTHTSTYMPMYMHICIYIYTYLHVHMYTLRNVHISHCWKRLFFPRLLRKSNEQRLEQAGRFLEDLKA